MPVIREAMIKLTSFIFFAIFVIIGATATAADKAEPSTANDRNEVVLETNKGIIVLVLDEKSAPKTVANFKKYVETGFYENTIFHRIIPGFMIQGGGFSSDLKRKQTQAPIKNEADNGLQNTVGTIAMARTNDPHSATSQFFINVNDNVPLNFTEKSRQGWGYTVFGKVIEGLDLVMSISEQATQAKRPHANLPIDTVVIQKAYFR